MKVEDLKYILETLNYGLESCIDQNNSIETHYNQFANAISLVEDEVRSNEIKSIELINYIENEAEIAMPIGELIRKDGSHLTKMEYGKILLKYLVKELRLKYTQNSSIINGTK